jgi:uncharacterized protein (TIGR02588 family)
MTKISDERHVEAGEPHWIEWFTGIVSSVIVVAVIAWIAKDAMIDRDASPDLTGVVVHTERRSGGFQVLFEIRNESTFTASHVTVHGELRDQSSVLESTDTVLDYVPGHSTAKGGFIFEKDPAGKTVVIRPSAFNEP